MKEAVFGLIPEEQQSGSLHTACHSTSTVTFPNPSYPSFGLQPICEATPEATPESVHASLHSLDQQSLCTPLVVLPCTILICEVSTWLYLTASSSQPPFVPFGMQPGLNHRSPGSLCDKNLNELIYLPLHYIHWPVDLHATSFNKEGQSKKLLLSLS